MARDAATDAAQDTRLSHQDQTRHQHLGLDPNAGPCVLADLVGVFNLSENTWHRAPTRSSCNDSSVVDRLEELIEGKIDAARRGRSSSGRRSEAGYLHLMGHIEASASAVPGILAEWSRSVHRFLVADTNSL